MISPIIAPLRRCAVAPLCLCTLVPYFSILIGQKSLFLQIL